MPNLDSDSRLFKTVFLNSATLGAMRPRPWDGIAGGTAKAWTRD